MEKAQPMGPTLGAEFEAGLDLALDAGIRDYVLALREGGVETFESCEGGPGHASPVPMVRIWGTLAAGFKAYGVALDRGLPVSRLMLEAYAVQNIAAGLMRAFVSASTPALRR